MKSITNKIDTLRKATASSVVLATAQTIERLKSNDVPKKDILIIARAAGVMAAKKTQEIIPYCHPIPIDSVDIHFEVLTDRVVITASVEAIWKTGVEMEALTASSVAALTIYDMLKPVDKNMEIVSTKLLVKTGGKSDFVDEMVEKASSKEDERLLMEEKLLLLQSGLRDLIVWRKTKNETLLIHRDYREQISHFASQLEMSLLEDKIASLEQLTQGLDRNANLKLTRAVLEIELADLGKTK